MMQLIFESSVYPRKITLNDEHIYTSDELNQIIQRICLQNFGSTLDYYLLHNGKIYDENKCTRGTIQVVPRLKGGKGGFGSMLRAIGAQIEKTTNREACRDLSGRRLRDINEEKRLKKWIAEQAEREQEALKRKKKKLEKLTEIVKHEFVDEDYTKSRLEMPDKIHESVEEGLKAAAAAAAAGPSTGQTTEADEGNLEKNVKPEEKPTSSKKIKNDKRKKITKEIKPKEKKKIKGNLWVDDLEGLDDSETSEEESPKKKPKTS